MSFENHIDNKESVLLKFIYRDNRIKDSKGYGKTIFECEAIGILEADEQYKKVMGKDPEKQNYIGCSIK
jgi:hypothetical protein